MTGLAELLAGAAAVAVSGAIHPTVRSEIAGIASCSVDVLAVVRGRAVVPPSAGYDRVVVGAPNHLGRTDAGAGAATVFLWDPSLTPRPAGVAIVVGPRGEDEEIEARTQLARYLVKRLCQIRGVTAPWVPETPVAIVMLPFDPPPGMPSLGPGFAGIPAALRLVVPAGATTRLVTAYAAQLEAELERGGRA